MTEAQTNYHEDPEKFLDQLLDLLKQVRVPQVQGLASQLAQLKERVHAALFSIRRQINNENTVIAILVGPSGSGKSTLFNAIVGNAVSHTSSIERPATKGAICALPARVHFNQESSLFPTLPRAGQETSKTAGDTGAVHFLPETTESPVVLVDCPDFDTVARRNQEVTRCIVPWADVILFVTSTEKYADQSAVDEFKNYGDLGVPIIAVLNRIPTNNESLQESFESEIANLGIEPLATFYIDENDTGSLADLADIQVLRDRIAGTALRDQKNLDPIAFGLHQNILPAVNAWASSLDRLREDLSRTIPSAMELETDQALRNLEYNEEIRKFWLRYSPRSVIKGIRTIVTQPRTILSPRKEPVLDPPENCALDKTVKNQAWDLFESSQIRARETMQEHEVGSLLLAKLAGPNKIELSKEEVFEKFQELATRLNEFGKKCLKDARLEKTAHQSGPMGTLRLWAVDKVLHLLTLGLTLAVVPAIVWELLRVIGLPSFTNAMTQEYRLAKKDFRKIMDETIAWQNQRYENELNAMGTSAETTQALNDLGTAFKPGAGRSKS